MSELTFEQMLEESLKTIHAGEVVEGTVIDVKPEEVILNIGYKSDGILAKNEYTNDPGVDMTAVVKTGDKMEVKVYYDKMYMIVETSADFFVFPDKQTALLIPKHQMENVKEESRYLRQMFHTYATENKLCLMKG